MSHPPGTCWDGATFSVRWRLASKELGIGVWDGSANFVCCHVLWALAPSCGCSVTCPVSRGPLGCCSCLSLSCAGWSPWTCCGAAPLPQHWGRCAFAGSGLASHSSRDLITARNCPNVCCWVEPGAELLDTVGYLRVLKPRPVTGKWQEWTGNCRLPKFLNFQVGGKWFTGVDSVKVLHSQIISTSVSLTAELPTLPQLAWIVPFPL